MRINRLFEIVYLLIDKKTMTATELAAHFEVSKRTILRDIDTLATAGIPVYTSQGKGGGIFIHDKFVINKTVLSEDEQKQILFALQGISATKHIEAQGVLSRLRSLFEKTDSDWIEVDFSRWGNSATDKAKFDILKNAIIREQAISFTYSSSYGETTDRRVYPLKLAFKSNAWYLQAFCVTKNDYRTFRISRMRKVDIVPETFDSAAFQAPEIDPAECQPTNHIDVKLRFSPHAVYRAYDEFDERNIVKNNDGSLTVSMGVPDDQWLYCYVLSFGDHIEVLEPRSVREEIARQAQKIKDKYPDKT